MNATTSGKAKLNRQRPFSRRQALDDGIDLRELRGPTFRRIFTGIYVDATVELTPLIRAAAALVAFDARAFVSHASAARVLGLPIPTLPDEHVTVLHRNHRRQRPGIVCHLLPQASVMTIGGVRLSGQAQTFVELASILSLVDLVVVGDHLVRHRHLTVAELRAFCAASTLPGAGLARLASTFVRERVDSPMETRLRMLIVLAGLPEPEVNLSQTVAGQTRRFDLCWPECHLIVEYDGRHHIEREQQWEADLTRREEIEDDEWRVIVVLAKGIYTSPEETVTKIWRLLRERGQAGVPGRLSDDWRPHFPGRAAAA